MSWFLDRDIAAFFFFMYFAGASNNWVPFSAIWHEAADIYLQNLATDTK